MADKRIVKPGKSMNQVERLLYECCANLADIKKDHKRNAKPWYKYDRLHWKLSQLGFELGLAKCTCVDIETFRKEI